MTEKPDIYLHARATVCMWGGVSHFHSITKKTKLKGKSKNKQQNIPASHCFHVQRKRVAGAGSGETVQKKK